MYPRGLAATKREPGDFRGPAGFTPPRLMVAVQGQIAFPSTGRVSRATSTGRVQLGGPGAPVRIW
jgi:hypothetical protein